MTLYDDLNNVVRLADVVRRINSSDNTEDILIIDSTMTEEHPEYPVRFDALVIILVKEGSGTIEINLQEYEVSPGSLVILTPKDYVSRYSKSVTGRARVMMCGQNIVENVLPKIRDLLPLLINHVEQSVINLDESDEKMISELMELMRRQLAQTGTLFREQKASTLMQNMLFFLMELRHKANIARKARSTRKEEIMSKFLKLISENFKTCRTVQYYAEELCVTPKHLTTTIKEVSNRTAREWIDDFVIMEAKQLLRASSLTIQEIADRLYFANQSFFGKYFKNLTGESPTSYRIRARGK